MNFAPETPGLERAYPSRLRHISFSQTNQTPTHMKLKHSFSSIVLAIALGGFCACTANADHGKDFIILQDYHVPAPGGGHLMGNFEWEKYSDRDEFGLSSGLMFGVLPRVALGVDVHFRDESDGWDYNSVMPAAQFQLTSPESKFPIKVALAVGYQFVNGSSIAESAHEEVGGHAEEHAHEHEHEHGHADEHADVEEHAEEGGHSHDSTVHNHSSDALKSRLIIEGDFGATKAIFNLISLVRDGGDAGWGYAAGVRHNVNESVALGVEALGDFESDGWHELIGGIYYQPIHAVTLKIGAGFGLTDATPDFTLRTGVVWRF